MTASSVMARITAQRIQEGLDEKQLTARQASLKAGLSADAIRSILRRPDDDPRGSTLAAIAPVIERSVPYLLGVTDDPAGGATAPPRAEFLPIRYRVAAGVWRERDDEAQEFIGEGPMPPPDAFSSFPQWWEMVEGESINKIYPPGALVRVIDAIAIGYRPRHDDLVVIERRRNGSAERTVKQVRIRGSRIIVHGASTNKKWNTELDVTEGLIDGDEAEIVGFVAGAYIVRR